MQGYLGPKSGDVLSEHWLLQFGVVFAVVIFFFIR